MMLAKNRSRTVKTYKTVAEKLHMSRVAALGCIIQVPHKCGPRVTLHHCHTGMGRRKDHMKVIPICWNLHISGPESIDGKVISKKAWQEKYGAEDNLLAKVAELLK